MHGLGSWETLGRVSKTICTRRKVWLPELHLNLHLFSIWSLDVKSHNPHKGSAICLLLLCPFCHVRRWRKQQEPLHLCFNSARSFRYYWCLDRSQLHEGSEETAAPSGLHTLGSRLTVLIIVGVSDRSVFAAIRFLICWAEYMCRCSSRHAEKCLRGTSIQIQSKVGCLYLPNKPCSFCWCRANYGCV